MLATTTSDEHDWAELDTTARVRWLRRRTLRCGSRSRTGAKRCPTRLPTDSKRCARETSECRRSSAFDTFGDVADACAESAAPVPVDQLFRRNQLVRIGRRLFRAGADPASKGLRLRGQAVEEQADQGLGPVRAARHGRLSVSTLRLCRQQPEARSVENQLDQQHVGSLAQTEAGAENCVDAENHRGAVTGACAGQASLQWRFVSILSNPLSASFHGD